MQTRRLYRVTRADGGVDVTPIMPDGGEYTISYRLIADDGYIITDGTTQTPCVDTDAPEAWSEVPHEPDYYDDATEEEKALTRYTNELTGENDHDLVSATESLIIKFMEE